MSPSPETDGPAAWPLFLDVDYDFRFAQLIGQAFVVAPQLLVLASQGIGLHLGPPLLRSQSLQNSVLPLPPPLRQMRRIEPLAPQQSADVTRLLCRICLCQYLLLVLRGEPAPFGASYPSR